MVPDHMDPFWKKDDNAKYGGQPDSYPSMPHTFQLPGARIPSMWEYTGNWADALG